MFDPDMLIPITFFIMIGYIVKSVSDNRVRHRLIEKGLSDKDVQTLYLARLESSYLSSLKWGLVLIGLGVALLIAQIYPEFISEEFIIGIMFLLAGVAFLAYYFIARHLIGEKSTLEN